MKPIHNLSLLVALIFSLCGSSGVHFRKGILNNNIYRQLQQNTDLEKEPRSVLAFDNGQTATNCIEYISLLKESTISETVHNKLIKSEYLICDLIHLIDNNNIAINTSNDTLGVLLATYLDLRSFPNSLSQMIDDSKVTLMSLAPEDIIIKGNSVKYETSDWVLFLEVVAVTDLNNNSKNDLIIWLSDEAMDGNYRSYETLIAYDVIKRQLIEAKVYSLK